MSLHMYRRMVANTKLGLRHHCKVQHQCKVHHSNRDECEKDSLCEHLTIYIFSHPAFDVYTSHNDDEMYSIPSSDLHFPTHE